MFQSNRENYSVQELGERFALLSDQAVECALFLVSTDGTIRTWNAGAQRLFGYHALEIVGKDFNDLFSQEDVQTHLPQSVLNAAFSQGKSINEASQKRKDGTIFQCRTIASAIMDENSEVHVYAIVVRDNTTSEKARKQATRVSELLEYYEHTQSFFSLLAHELQSPLIPICTALELLRRTDHSDTLALDVVDLLQRQVDVLRSMVSDLLDISRISTTSFEIFPEPSNLNTIVDQACKETQPIFDNLSQTLELTLASQPVWANVDRKRIHQVMMNLLCNASKFTPSGGRIDVSVSIQDAQAVVRVLDNGMGLKQSMIPHIFDLFPQTGEQSVKTRGGLGLGLAISRSIAELHDGSLNATSPGLTPDAEDFGGGSEFCLRLPLVTEPPQTMGHDSLVEVPEAIVQENAVVDDALRVLVISDQIDFARSLQKMLLLSGCEVQRAASREDAIAKTTAFSPQVVLLDMELQMTSPYALAQQIDHANSCRSRQLIALTSGPPSELEIIRGLGFRFNSFLEKPIDFDRLQSLLTSASRSAQPTA